VVVSFAITAIALGGLYEIYRMGLKSVGRARHERLGLQIAQMRMALAEGESPLSARHRSGTVDIYDWAEDVAPIVADPRFPTPTVPAYAITVRVTWPPATASDALVLSTVRLSPAGLRP
jgi:hypothetical protein